MAFRSLLILLFGFPWILVASNSPSDSLLQALEEAEKGKERIDILLDLAHFFKDTDPSQTYKYSQQALTIEKDSPYPEARVLANSNLGYCYMNQGKMDTAHQYADQSIEEIALIQTPNRKIRVLENTSTLYMRLGDLETSRQYSQEGWNLSLETGDLLFGTKFAILLGVSYLHHGERDLALDWFGKALEGSKLADDPFTTGRALGNLGVTYQALGLHKDALKVLLEADSIFRAVGQNQKLAVLNFNIGVLYMEEDDHEEALEHFGFVLEVTNQTGQMRERGRAIGAMSEVYRSLDSLDKAIQYAEKSVRIQNDLQSPRDIADANIYLGIALMDAKQHERAIASLRITQQWARQNRDLDMLMKAQGYLANAYLESAQYKHAAFGYKQYQELNDSLFNAKSIREASDMAAKIEYEKEATRKEVEQKIRDDLEAAELKREKLVKNILLVALIGVVVFLAVMAWAIIRVRGQNRVLKQKGEEISFLNQNLESLVRERTKALEKRSAQLADYMFTNSHRVRGPIARILGLMQVHETGGFSSPTEQKQVFQFVHDAAKEADLVIWEISERLESGEEATESDTG